jgi:dimethylargininase
MLGFVREVSPRLAHCELTYLEREAIDVARAQRQHRDYSQALQTLGCRLEWLPPLPEHADGVFVEDTAVLLPEAAVITRPGVASRRGETPSVAAALARHVRVLRLTEPACLEGGDVLRIGRTLYAGTSGRTNAHGVAQLAAALAPFGYTVEAVAMEGCLHLKSACSFIAPQVLLVNPSWVDPAAFLAQRVIAVDEGEPYAANTLTLGGTTLVSAAYPQTRSRLEAAGITTVALEVSELHKAEAALTCMSLLLDTR